jgi:hypothetical protein
MPRTVRLTDALRGRGKALAVAGAAAALAGSGAASAVTMAAPGAPAAMNHEVALTGRGGPVSLAPAARAQVAAALGGAGEVTADTAAHHAVGHQAPGVHEAAAIKHVPSARDSARRHEVAGRAGVRRGGPSVRGVAGPARPYEIYDSVTPSSIPSGHEIATYADGGYAVSRSAVAGKKVLWIDTNGSDPKAAALDVEPGDASPAGAGSWAADKLHADPRGQAIIYTMRSEWPAAQAAVRASLPGSLRSHVRWWIADPTGVPHVLPGAAATQWYWGPNYDITTATPGF